MGEGGILTKIVAKVENNFKLRKKINIFTGKT